MQKAILVKSIRTANWTEAKQFCTTSLLNAILVSFTCDKNIDAIFFSSRRF